MRVTSHWRRGALTCAIVLTAALPWATETRGGAGGFRCYVCTPYDDGEARRAEAKREAQYTRSKAEAGDPVAQFKMHQSADSGDARLWTWLCLSANQGYAPAQREAGLAFESGGSGRDRDPAEAYLWYSLAAQQQDVVAIDGQKRVAQGLTRAQIDRAKRAVSAWTPDPNRCGVVR